MSLKFPPPDPEDDLGRIYHPEALSLGVLLPRTAYGAPPGASRRLPGSLLEALRAYRLSGDLDAFQADLPLVPSPVRPDAEGRVTYRRRNLLAEKVQPAKVPVSWVFAFVHHGVWPPTNDKTVRFAAHYHSDPIGPHRNWFAPVRPSDLVITHGFLGNYTASHNRAIVSSTTRERDAWMVLSAHLPTDANLAMSPAEVVQLLMDNGFTMDEALLLPGLILHKHSIGRPRAQGSLRVEGARLYIARAEGTFREPLGRSPYPDPFDPDAWRTRGKALKEARRQLAIQYPRTRPDQPPPGLRSGGS